MANDTFIQHYIDYITSPAGLLALLLAFPLLLYVQKEFRVARPRPDPLAIPGCLRVARRTESNLADQYDPPSKQHEEPYVKAIFVYPVKSCRGIELSASEVSSTGLKYDRLFSFAQLVSTKAQTPDNSEGFAETNSNITHQWRFITQREFPRLALLSTELWVPDPRDVPNEQKSVSIEERRPDAFDTSSTPRRLIESGNTALTEVSGASKKHSTASQVEDWTANGGCLVIRFPYETGSIFGSSAETVTLKIPLQPSRQRVKAKGYTFENMSIWTDQPRSINVSNEIQPDSLAKLKYFLGVSNPLGLFRVDDSRLRNISRSLPKDRLNDRFQVGFADAFPVHLLNVASVRAVDESMPKDAKTKQKLDAIRFRANIYVAGPPAYDEDEWKRISAGQDRSAHSDGEPAVWHPACRTARCTLPNVDPETGLKDRNEPHSTLKRMRQVDKGAKPHPCLGLSLMPLFKQGIIRCGDKIEVPWRGEHVYEKMFP